MFEIRAHFGEAVLGIRCCSVAGNTHNRSWIVQQIRATFGIILGALTMGWLVAKIADQPVTNDYYQIALLEVHDLWLCVSEIRAHFGDTVFRNRVLLSRWKWLVETEIHLLSKSNTL